MVDALCFEITFMDPFVAYGTEYPSMEVALHEVEVVEFEVEFEVEERVPAYLFTRSHS